MLRRCACVVALLTVINYWRSHHKTSVRHLIIRFLTTLYFNAMVFRYRRSIHYDKRRYPGIRPSAEHMALDKILDLTAVGSHLKDPDPQLFLRVWRWAMSEGLPILQSMVRCPLGTRRADMMLNADRIIPRRSIWCSSKQSPNPA